MQQQGGDHQDEQPGQRERAGHAQQREQRPGDRRAGSSSAKGDTGLRRTTAIAGYLS
ncbi:MAG: hypothetical protein JO325_04455 [Solirubrobacterales bacterium]|nr:hypothetical protein [Solirubrobacterales bacterium]